MTEDRVTRRLADLASMAEVAGGIVAKGEDTYLADEVNGDAPCASPGASW